MWCACGGMEAVLAWLHRNAELIRACCRHSCRLMSSYFCRPADFMFRDSLPFAAGLRPSHRPGAAAGGRQCYQLRTRGPSWPAAAARQCCLWLKGQNERQHGCTRNKPYHKKHRLDSTMQHRTLTPCPCHSLSACLTCLLACLFVRCCMLASPACLQAPGCLPHGSVVALHWLGSTHLTIKTSNSAIHFSLEACIESKGSCDNNNNQGPISHVLLVRMPTAVII